MDSIIEVIIVVIGLFFAVGSFYLANADKEINKGRWNEFNLVLFPLCISHGNIS